MDQKLFRELENIRGREKRSNFIEYLIIQGLKTHITNQQNTKLSAPIVTNTSINKIKKDFVG
jgi:metal-responsive CopG/Arc/MetJ family transcriptional regulator